MKKHTKDTEEQKQQQEEKAELVGAIEIRATKNDYHFSAKGSSHALAAGATQILAKLIVDGKITREQLNGVLDGLLADEEREAAENGQ